MIIYPQAIEEIKRIKLSERIIGKYYTCNEVKIETEFFILQATLFCINRFMKIDKNITNKKEFDKQFIEILKIEKQIKRILKKHGQF